MRICGFLIALTLGACATAFGGPVRAACRDGKDRHVRILNDGATPIRELHASNINVLPWEDVDLLGDHLLAPGQAVTVDLEDGTCYCTYDWRAVLADRTLIVRRGFDVCADREWRIRD